MHYLIICIFALFSVNASAKDKSKISGDIHYKLQFQQIKDYSDDLANTDNNDYEVGNHVVEAYPRLKIDYSDNISIHSAWHILQLKTGNQKDDRYFEDIGATLEELYLSSTNNVTDFFIGKFNPKFGKAWDWDMKTGIWGSDIAELYKLTAKIGLGFNIKTNLEEYGKHKISFASFYNDNTDLNNSIISKRELYEDSVLGRAGDTGGLSSYTVNLYGEEIDKLPSLFYNASYRYVKQGGQVVGVGAEEGFSLAVGANYKIKDNFYIHPFAEYTKINNFNSFNNKFNKENGFSNFQIADSEFTTYSIVFSYIDWSFNYNKIFRDFEYSAKESSYDHHEYSLTYKLINNMDLSFGKKKFQLSDGETVSEVSLLLELKHKL
jgi:hypothetical protein